jgi:hypothetical protein
MFPFLGKVLPFCGILRNIILSKRQLPSLIIKGATTSTTYVNYRYNYNYHLCKLQVKLQLPTLLITSAITTATFID